jgi:hypothetical protein
MGLLLQRVHLRTLRLRGARIAAGLVFVTGVSLILGAGPVPEPVRLTLMDASVAAGLEWSSRITHDIDIAANGHTATAQRDYRIRFRFEAARAGTADSVSVTARIDSARAATVIHDGRRVLDARRLPGTTFSLAWARTGGRPAYGRDVPTIDFGTLGGPLPVSLLVDPLFPLMPDRPVSIGDTWEREWVRDHVNGTSLGGRAAMTRFALATIERSGGHTIARIDIESRLNALAGFILIGP